MAFPTPANPVPPINPFPPVHPSMYAGQPPLQYPPSQMLMGPGLVPQGYDPGFNVVPQGPFPAPGMMVNSMPPQGIPVPIDSPSVHLHSNVSEQQVLIPQPPHSQIIQEVRRIPMQIPGPPNRHVVRNFTQRVVMIPQPPEVRLINETIRRPVVISQPPQIQTVFDRVPRTVMVPVPPEIRMQRSEVVEGPFMSGPQMAPLNVFPPHIMGSMYQPPLPFLEASQNMIQPPFPFPEVGQNMIQPPLPFPEASQNIIQPPMMPPPIPPPANVVINSYSPTAVVPQGEIAISNPMIESLPPPISSFPVENPPMIMENPIPPMYPPESGFFKQTESMPQPSILMENRPL